MEIIRFIPAMAVRPAKAQRSPSQEPREGMGTPWGRADSVRSLIPGAWAVSTPSHGGIKLSRARNARMPDYMRQEGGWYEEDCQWAMPYLVFWSEFEPFEKSKANEERAVLTFAEVENTVKNWNPDEYQQFTGKTLEAGESLIWDERIFAAKFVDQLVAVHYYFPRDSPHIPEGSFGVGCVNGGRRAWETMEDYLSNPYKHFRWFLLPNGERDNQRVGKERGTVVDPAKFEEYADAHFDRPVR